jgi:hypothetical protein
MFREMRRKDKELSAEETRRVFENGLHGMLATAGDGEYPYAVPLNYVYCDGSIFIHSAREGRKVDEIRRHPKVSFCVVEMARLLPETFDTDYRSAIAFGEADELLGADKEKALSRFVAKYSADYQAKGVEYIKGKMDSVSVFRIRVEHMTGKHQE